MSLCVSVSPCLCGEQRRSTTTEAQRQRDSQRKRSLGEVLVEPSRGRSSTQGSACAVFETVAQQRYSEENYSLAKSVVAHCRKCAWPRSGRTEQLPASAIPLPCVATHLRLIYTAKEYYSPTIAVIRHRMRVSDTDLWTHYRERRGR